MTTAQDKDSLATKRSRFKVLEEYWADDRKAFLEDIKFAAGEQWPEKIKKARDDANRPCLTVDKSGQYIRQVVNDSRQNRPAIKVRPIDDHGDVQVADALQGLCRHVADRSNADDAYDCGVENAVKGGFGFIRVITEYAHDNTFNQEIAIKRVPNSLSVLMGEHQEADGSDARDCFIYTDIPKKEFKERWLDATETNWEADGYKDSWTGDETVRVCEYFYKVEEKTARHLLEDGTVVSDADYQLAVTNGIPDIPAIVETRDLPTVTVKWCRMTGAEILEEADWLGKHIPVAPVYGNETNIEGKVIHSGLIRTAKDAMRLYNFSRTAFAESLSLSTKAPWVASAEAIENFEDEWKNANNENNSVLHVNAFNAEGEAIPPPQRQPGAPVPEGFSRDMQIAEHDIQAAMGMFNASLGERSNETSGVAIKQRRQTGDAATFHFQDNLNRAVRRIGVILVDLFPKVYDSKRVIRMLGEDAKATEAVNDPEQKQAVMKQGGVTIYNLGIGQYDVNISSGASYTTRRAEQADALMQLVQADPTIMQIAGDLVVGVQDFPQSEELAERYRAMLPPPIQQAIQAEDAGGSPEMLQAKQYVDTAMEHVKQAQGQIQQAGQQLQQEQQKVAADKASLDAQRAKLDASAAKLTADEQVLAARFAEYSAKLDLKALQTAQTLAPTMPPGPLEPAIAPNASPPPPSQPTQPADAGFFTPEAQQ